MIESKVKRINKLQILALITFLMYNLLDAKGQQVSCEFIHTSIEMTENDIDSLYNVKTIISNIDTVNTTSIQVRIGFEPNVYDKLDFIFLYDNIQLPQFLKYNRAESTLQLYLGNDFALHIPYYIKIDILNNNGQNYFSANYIKTLN